MRQGKNARLPSQNSSGNQDLPVQLNQNPFIPLAELKGTHAPLHPVSSDTSSSGSEVTPPVPIKQAPSAKSKEAASSKPQTNENHADDPNQNFQLTDFDRALIRRKAWQLIGKYGFGKNDLDDIQQELALQLVRSAPAFDPNRSHRNVFSVVVIDRGVASMVRKAKAEKRDYRRRRNFSDIGNDASNDAQDWVQQFHTRTESPFPDLIPDELNAVEAGLTEELQAIFRWLKEMNLAEIQRNTGISRYILLRRIDQLRRILIAAGLDYRPPGHN